MFPLDECSFRLSSYNVRHCPPPRGSLPCPLPALDIVTVSLRLRTLYSLSPVLPTPTGSLLVTRVCFLYVHVCFCSVPSFCCFVCFLFQGKWSNSVSVSLSHLLHLAKCSPGPSLAEAHGFFLKTYLRAVVLKVPSRKIAAVLGDSWLSQTDELETPEVRYPVSTSVLMFQQGGSDQGNSRWFLRQPGPSTLILPCEDRSLLFLNVLATGVSGEMASKLVILTSSPGDSPKQGLRDPGHTVHSKEQTPLTETESVCSRVDHRAPNSSYPSLTCLLVEGFSFF